MEARRFPEPEGVGSIPTAGAFALDHRLPDEKGRSRQDSNLQPLDPKSNALPLSHATAAKSTSRGARTHDHKVKSLALYRLS